MSDHAEVISVLMCKLKADVNVSDRKLLTHSYSGIMAQGVNRYKHMETFATGIKTSSYRSCTDVHGNITCTSVYQMCTELNDQA